MIKVNSLAKQAAGYAAAKLVQNGMVVGLGTGSTAEYFIQALSERHQTGLKFQGVPTSKKSYELAQKLNIPLISNDEIINIDLAVDGADEITEQKTMIKGGGGALLREKIIASASKEFVVIVTDSKLVRHLGNFPLPVEILSFAYKTTIRHILSKNYQGSLRLKEDNQPYVTDNGNYIFDINLNRPISNPEIEHLNLCTIPGILETGFFYNVAGKVIIGFDDGHIEVLT